MRIRLPYSIAVIIAITCSPSSALDIGGINLSQQGIQNQANNLQSSIASAFPSFDSLSAVPGLGMPVIKCENPLGTSFSDLLSRIGGACRAFSKIQNNLTFSFGGCTTNTKAGDCAKQAVSDFCNSGKNALLKEGRDGEKALFTPMSAVGLSTTHSVITGGDIVMTGKDVSCSERISKTTNGVTYGSVTENSVLTNTSMTKLPGFGAFDRMVETARDCMREVGLAGKSEAAAKDICLKRKAYGLPANKSDAEMSINKTAGQFLVPADKGMIASMATTESDLAQKMKKCAGTDPASCESTVVADVKKSTDSGILNVELTKARQLKIMEEAAMGPNLIVHYDDDSINALPAQLKAEYGSAAKRQLSFVTAYQYLANEDASIDKEFLSVVNNKITESARPFYEANAIADIEKSLK